MTDPSQTLSIGSVPALATDSPALAQDVGAGTAGQDQAPSGGAATPAVQLPLESSAAAKDATHGHSLPNNASDSSFNIQGSPASPQLSFDELGRPLQLQRGAEAGYTPAPTLTSEYKARGSSSMMGLGISSLFASTSNPVAAVMPPGASLPTPVLFPLRGDSVSMPSPSVSRGTFPSPPTLPKPAKLPEEAASPPLTTSTKSGFRARLFSRSKASFSATPPSLAPTGDSVPSLPLSPPPAGPATSMGTEGGASGKGRQGTEQFENDLVSSMTLPPGSATAGKVGGVESLEEVGEAGESIKGATAAGAEPGTTDRLRRDIGQLESDLGSSMAPPIAQRQGARVRPQPIDTSVQMKEGIISATGSSSSMEAPTPRSRDTASPPVSTSAAGAGSSFLGSGFARGMFDGLRRGGSASKKEGQLGSNVGSKGKSREPDSPLSASVLGAPLAVFGPDERLPRSREDSGPHEMGRSYSTAYAPPPHAVNVRLGLLASADNIITPPSVSSPRLGPRLHQSQSQDQFRPPPHLRSASVGGVSSNAHDIISKTSSAPASAASAPGPASHSAFVKVATYPANRSFPNSGSVLPDSASNDSAPTAPGTYSAAAGRADEARYMLMSAPKSLSFFGIQPKNAAASAPVGEKAAAAAACAAATATAIAARKKDAAGPGWHQDEIGDGDEGGNVASSLPSGASEAIISRHQSVSGMSDGTMVTASTGPHSRTESFSGPSIAGDMREGQFSLHALAPGSKTPMQESSSGSVASPSSSEGLRFATPSKWPTASSTTFQRPSLKTRDSEISLPELTKVGSYSDSGHESAFSASPPEVPMLRRLGATRRTSFLPPAAELTHSSSAGCGNTPIGSAGSFGAGLSGSAAPSPASQPESAPGTRTGGGHKWHSRMLSASQLSKLNPGTRILADLEATQPVAPRALVPAGKSRRVIVRRASWPFESKEAAKSKAKKGARHRRQRRPPSITIHTQGRYSSKHDRSSSSQFLTPSSSHNSEANGFSSLTPAPSVNASQSFLSFLRGPRPGGPRGGLPISSSEASSAASTLRILTSNGAMTRKSGPRPLGPPPAPSAFSRNSQPLAPSLSSPGALDEPPDSARTVAPQGGFYTVAALMGRDEGLKDKFSDVGTVRRRPEPLPAGSFPPPRPGSAGNEMSTADGRTIRRRTRGDSMSSMMSSESAPITPRSSSLVQVPIDGSVSGPTLPRRSDSIRRVLLPRCSTDSPTSPRLVSAWQQTFTSSGSSPATPGSIETGEERQLEHLNVVDGEQEMLESPSYDSPVSPPTPSEQSEKPALPKRNPLRRYAGPALASAQGSRQMGLGVVLPSPASTVGTRSVSNYVPSPQRHTAADRRVSSSDVKGEMELLRDTLREGNRSQTSLASTSVSAKDKDKDKGRRWNPLKDVFSEGEDSGHGFARSMRFRTKKASRAKDIKHFFTSEALQSGHSRSVSQMSTASTPQPEDTCLEESKEQKEARLAKMADDRTKVIRELIDTEKSYAVDLGIVRDIYLARAKSRLFAVSPTLTSSPSASAVSFGTPSISSSYFGSPLTGSGTPARQRFASSSSNRLPAKAAPQEGSSLLASPFQQRPGSPPSIDSSELSNRSSLYTVPSAISSTTSETGFTIPGSRLPSLVSDTLSPELGSASMRKSISQGTMGASQSGPINGHHHAEAPRSGSLTSQFSGLKDAPFSLSDIRIIFAGLEACASLADEMSQRLQNVVHNGDQESSSIGARLASFFIDAAPRITSTYSAYCASHTASISRLQELTTTSSKGAAFIKETTQVARQYTNAWDLASLLIKPVQRVLKYPLLLRQILKSTDPQADDYSALERALADLEALAERINEQKRRQEFIEGVVNSKFQAPSKAPGASSKSSKKLRRQHEQLKAIVGPRVNNDDILSLVGRLQNTEESVLAFSRAVSDWVKACRKAIDIQSQLMETWSDLLAKLGEEESNSSDHVEIFLALLQGELSTHWGRLDDNVHGILLPFTDTIMSMFAGPKKVVERHQQHETDYTRYQQVLSKNEKKTPDKRLVQNASEYIALHVQLLEELPQFLNGVKALVDWAVLMLANMQLDYYQKVHSEVQRFHIALKHAGTQEVVRADGFEIDEALELDLALQPLPAGVNTSDHVPPGFTQLNYGSHVTMQGTEGVSPTVADRLAADSPYVDKLSLHSAEQSSSAHGSAAGQSADGAALRPSSAVTEASVKAAGSKSAPSGFRRLVRTISVSRKRLEAAPHVDQMPEVPAKDTVPSSPPLLPELPVLVPLRNTPPDSASAAAAPPSDELDSHRRRPAKLSLSSIPLLGGEDKLSDSIVTMATNVDGPEQLDFKISPVSLLPYKAGELLQVFASVPSPAAPLATTSQTHIQVAEQSQGSYVAPSQNAAEHVLARNLEGTVGWVERRCLTQVV